MLHRFKRPVTIRWSRGMQGIGDVHAALEAMRNWVSETDTVTPEIAAAYVVCAEVLDGTRPAEDAREAFVAAARGMGKLRGE
ncbi:DUF982 domain-containing protein [Mesorhizobium sp. M0088]|uniref:DUF982 domain-containing protein n=1 Tax=Mesorhizobium sp. M0088 TaxID=2956873 RepID=UPI003337DDE0